MKHLRWQEQNVIYLQYNKKKQALYKLCGSWKIEVIFICMLPDDYICQTELVSNHKKGATPPPLPFLSIFHLCYCNTLSPFLEHVRVLTWRPLVQRKLNNSKIDCVSFTELYKIKMQLPVCLSVCLFIMTVCKSFRLPVWMLLTTHRSSLQAD